MKIIAHRGLWKKIEERNSMDSLIMAIEQGFGIETDIRDYCGELVISHDIPNERCSKLADFLDKYHMIESKDVLALNVKADGIQKKIRELLDLYEVNNYFLFDMSVPEMVVNKKSELKFMTRYSDIEMVPVLYEDALGVWVDCFANYETLDMNKIKNFILSGKAVCFVSPELHGHAYWDLWNIIKKEDFVSCNNVAICTDRPFEAKEYFYG